MDEPTAILDDGEVETLFGVVRRLTAERRRRRLHLAPPGRDPRASATASRCSRRRARPRPACRATTPTGELVEQMVGPQGRAALPRRARRGDRRRCCSTCAASRGCPRCAACRFEVHAGEVVGLAGLVGSGRTELLRPSTARRARTPARCWIDGEPAAARPAATPRSRAGLGLVPEDRKSQGLLLDWQPGQERRASPTSAASAAGCSTSRAEREAAARSCARSTPSPDDVDRHRARCSRAATSRRSCWRAGCCATPRAAARRADARRRRRAKAEIYRLIAELAASGLGVLVVSSELEELVGICDRILVMREGEIVAEVAGARRDASASCCATPSRRRTRPVLAEEVAGPPSDAPAERGRPLAASAALELQEYALAIVVVAAVRRRRDPRSRTRSRRWDNVRNMLTQASVVGVLAIGMTFVIATAASTCRSARSSPPPACSAASCSSDDGGSASCSSLGAIGVRDCCSARSTRRRSPTAASCRSSRRSRCSRSPGGWRCCSTTSCRSACSTSTAARSATRRRSRCCGSAPAGSPASRSSVFVFLGDHHRRLGAAQPHPLRPLRRRRRRQPRGGADRRRAGAQDHLQRLRALRPARRRRHRAAVRAARQRLAGQRQPLRARRDRRRRHRRHEPRRRPGDDRRDLPRASSRSR